MNNDPSVVANVGAKRSDRFEPCILEPDTPSESQRFRPRNRLSFLGAGALVAVGYMDPGNWATALESGARYR